MQTNKPESQPSAVEDRQHQGPFLPVLMEELLEATSENDLIETALSVLDRECRPIVSMIGVLPPGNETGFQISIRSHLAEADTAKLWEVVQKLFDSGIRSSSEDIFRSFSFLGDASILAEESTLASAIRIKALVFGTNDLESGHVSLHRLLRLVELKLGALRLSTGMRRAGAYLSRLHESAEALSRNLLNGDQIMQTLSEEARRILGVESAAILMSADETKTSFTVKAQSGFPEATLPVSTALFIRTMETSIDAPRKAIVHRGSDDHTSLMVPLIQAGSIEGALFLHSTDPAFEITEDLSRIAEIYGDWASIAIENAVMFSRVATSQREWENTFDSIADPIYIIDTEYRLLKMNRPLAGLAMKSIKLPANRNCYRYLFHRSTICPWCPVPKGMQSEGPEPIRVEAPLFSGGVWQIESFPLADKSRKRIGSINVMRDITVFKNMQEQLIESEKLASAGKLISGVAHEVRNPLFGISTTVRALANELGNREELKPYLDIVTSETARLNKLMEDLLNYSRPIQIDKTPSDITEIVSEVIQHFKTHPSGQNATIELHAAEGIPPILVDSNRIKQVLINLFENGIQHTEGKARIEVFLQHMLLSTPAEIHVVVKDNGKGISQENLQRIFDPFFTTRQRGTGLGLSIVRKVIHVHGGRIAVESHLGVGTTFRISIPANTVQQ